MNSGQIIVLPTDFLPLTTGHCIQYNSLSSMFDPSSIRRQFPILDQTIDGHPLIYLDSAATAQKPRAVLEAMQQFYEHDNGNAHRGMHVLAERATIAYEHARQTVKKFLNAKHAHEILFTKNATEAINLVARSWGSTLQSGDVIVLSIVEHHSNIVPWLQLKEQKGIELRWIDIDNEGQLKLEQLDEFLSEGNVKLVSITGLSNVLGVCPPLEKIIAKAHAAKAKVLIDAAQLVAHHSIDVQKLDVDFLAFSGHKLYGPTGIGVLYAKEELLDAMPPFLGGGTMINEVMTEYFTPADLPAKFEAGTQPMAEAVGLSAAIDWLTQYKWKDIEAHEKTLIETAHKELSAIQGLTILGPKNPHDRSGCISFTIDGIHPHDLTEILGKQGICLRAGHHCTQPLHRKLDITASSRLSIAIHSTSEEIQTTSASTSDCISRMR